MAIVKRKQDNFALSTTKREITECGPGKTEQSQAKFADVNYILRNYQKTGTMAHAKEYMGRYDDVSVGDFTEAMNMVTEANNMFESLPSHIRNKMGNMENFISFTSDPNNIPEMVKLGLIEGADGVRADGTRIYPAPPPTPVDTPPQEA